jgi:hypothetical protein
MNLHTHHHQKGPVMGHISTRARIATILLATAAAVAGVVTATGTGSQASAEHDRVLHFGVRFSPFRVIDVPPAQAHPGDYRAGDYTVFRDTLTDRTGHRVGTEGGTGTITGLDPKGAQIYYTMAIRLRHGEITAAGLGSPAPHKHLVVTGGSGSFAGADGTVSVVENGNGTGSLTVRLR